MYNLRMQSETVEVVREVVELFSIPYTPYRLSNVRLFMVVCLLLVFKWLHCGYIMSPPLDESTPSPVSSPGNAV